MYENLAECLVLPENLIQIAKEIEYGNLVSFEIGGYIKKNKKKLTFCRCLSDEQTLLENISNILSGDYHWIKRVHSYINDDIEISKLTKEYYNLELMVKKQIEKLIDKKDINLMELRKNLISYLKTSVHVNTGRFLGYHLHNGRGKPSETDKLLINPELVISYNSEFIDFYFITHQKSKKILTIKDIYNRLKQAP